jgi:transcriptional regulator with XRE-family HTH domain
MNETEPNNLRKLRREKDYSQEYMALELGISQKAYTNFENGKIELKQEKIILLSKILNTSISNICPISNYCDCNITKNEN